VPISMSIATRTGDDGTTGLMYNRRVPKSHRRVEAYGTVDELNAALGLARAAGSSFVRESILPIQKDLVILMGELCTAPEDLPRYLKDGFTQVSPEMTSKLDRLVHDLEAQNLTFQGWVMPGENMTAAALDLARTTCRRAERRISELRELNETQNAEILIYLNRLSDTLWLLARHAEKAS